MDFWRAGVIQGFVLNFSLYFLTFFNGACVTGKTKETGETKGETWENVWRNEGNM